MPQKLLFLAAILSLLTSPAYGEDVSYDWDQLVRQYADEHALVQLENFVEILCVMPKEDEVITTVKYTYRYAVFNPVGAEEIFNQRFAYFNETEVLACSGRSITLDGTVSETTENDSQTSEAFEGWFECSIAIPGLSEPGYVELDYTVKFESLPFMRLDFTSPFPLKHGRVRIVAPPTDFGYTPLNIIAAAPLGELERNFKGDPFSELINQIENSEEEFLHLDVEMKDLIAAMEEEPTVYTFEVSDLPGRDQTIMTPEFSQPLCALDIYFRYLEWPIFSQVIHELTKSLKVPKEAIKAVTKGVDKSDKEAVVLSLIRYLEDPKRFRTTDYPRELQFTFPDLKEVVESGEATIFEKALLAKCILDKLRIRNELCLAGSRYHSRLDWKTYNFEQFSAPLLRIRDIDRSYFWDVGAPWAPLGTVGADLKNEVFVIGDEIVEPILRVTIDKFYHTEKRTTELALGEDGLATGTLKRTFLTTPADPRLAPWTLAPGMEAAIGEGLSETVNLLEVDWTHPQTGAPRCSESEPAILECGIDLEAQATGEKGWSLKPFLTSLPYPYLGIADRVRSSFLISVGLNIHDTVSLEVSQLELERLPEPLVIENKGGTFRSTWSLEEGRLVASRELILHPNMQVQRSAKYAKELCQGWVDTGNEILVLE